MSAARDSHDTHAPRPTDLVALVTFDGEVYENQAVTRERLARPATTHPLNAAIEQWLGRRRRTWIDMRGRQIHGIATARELATADAWVIDTLVDASTSSGQGVAEALLRQAAQAAARHGVRHVLLRTRADAPAIVEAMRSGFKPALSERLWSGAHLRAASPPPSTVEVRERAPADAFALFQLYNRALPIDGRQALALTLDEWSAVQERRWLGRGAKEYLALSGERVSAALRLTPGREVAQFELLADADGAAAAAALLDRASAELAGAERVIALVPQCAAPLEAELRARGLEDEGEYRLLSLRTARPLAAPARATPEVVVPRGV